MYIIQLKVSTSGSKILTILDVISEGCCLSSSKCIILPEVTCMQGYILP